MRPDGLTARAWFMAAWGVHDELLAKRCGSTHWLEEAEARLARIEARARREAWRV